MFNKNLEIALLQFSKGTFVALVHDFMKVTSNSCFNITFSITIKKEKNSPIPSVISFSLSSQHSILTLFCNKIISFTLVKFRLPNIFKIMSTLHLKTNIYIVTESFKCFEHIWMVLFSIILEGFLLSLKV